MFCQPLPVPAIVSSPFSYNRVHPIWGDRRPHLGVDLAVAEGTEVNSAIEGKVTLAKPYGGYGNAVIVQNDDQLTLYAHLSQIAVKPGQTIACGQKIGAVGSTGWATGSHLHTELWLKDKTKADQWIPQDPLLFLPTNRSSR